MDREVSLSDVFTTDRTIQPATEEHSEAHNPVDYKLIPINAEEVRQYVYCKRVLYWRRVAGIHGVMSYRMHKGVVYHTSRTRYSYFPKGDTNMYHNRYFFDAISHIGGKVDLCRETEEAISVVEYKRYYHGKVFSSQVLQAMTGALAAEKELGKPCTSIEIQYYPGRSKVYVVNDALRSHTLNTIDQMKKMIVLQLFPEATPHTSKCRVCEFQKVCRRK